MLNESIFESSPIVEKYKFEISAHKSIVLQIAETLNSKEAENKSVVITKSDSGLDYSMLKFELSLINKDSDCVIVVIDHYQENVFEFCKLPEDCIAENFYKRIELVKFNVGNSESSPEVVNSRKSKIISVLNEYINGTLNDAKSYDVNPSLDKYYGEKIVSYAYIHKKLARSKEFKHAECGATQSIKDSINDLIDEGKLIELSQSLALSKYKSGARMFKIIVPALND